MDSIEIINLAPKFLGFFQKANGVDIDSNERWSLWEKHYNFAAVPPGDEGRRMARALLEKAWNKYEDHLQSIQNWEPNQEKVERFLSEVISLLGYEKSINFVVIYFVGFFEKNPFVAPYDQDRLALCLPIENEESDVTLVHELTHIVHSKTANLTGAWERTIASTILQEGLATQVSKYLFPGLSDEQYIEYKKGWLKSCLANRDKMIKGIIPYLEESSSETVTKFTFGSGTTNHDREAYFVGWELVRYLLEHGTTFNEIAGIQEAETTEYVKETCLKLLNESSAR